MAKHTKQTDHKMAVLFIDNSNIYIEGKKLHARKLKLYTEDPCFRIDIGNLCMKLLDGREMTHGKLYGSEPPALDTIWTAIRDKGLEVATYVRNQKGEEKEVDTALSTDATKYGCKNIKEKANTTIIILAGDRDYCPPVRALLDDEWHVEVASFSTALSDSIRQIKKEKKGNFLEIVEIDTFLLESQPPCYFVDRVWKHIRADFRVRHIPRHMAVAFSFKKEFNSKEDIRKLSELANNLTNIVKFPCRHHCYKGKLQSQTVLIIFYDKKARLKFEYEKLNTYRTEIQKTCEAIFTTYEFDKFEPAVNYYQRKKQKPPVEPGRMSRWFSTEEKNDAKSSESESVESGDENNGAQQDDMASPRGQLDVASGFQQLDPESVENSESGGDGYQVVEGKKTFSRVTTSKPCEQGFNCKSKTNCNKRHTKQEMEYFKFNRDQNTKINTNKNKYKSVPCHFKFQGRDCRTGNKPISPNCHFYHSLEEARCYVCRQIEGAIGHQASPECEYKSME